MCRKNQYAISVPIERQTASESIAVKAEAYGVEGLRIDGNDVLTVYQTVLRSVEKARDGGGPTLIEAFTYRLAPHSTADDPKRYRHQAEVNKWRQHDPIILCRKMLEQMGVWDEERDKALMKQCEQQVALKVEEVGKNAATTSAQYLRRRVCGKSMVPLGGSSRN
jgi:pyruvate dehydrogenase E1 component alpha subunit